MPRFVLLHHECPSGYVKPSHWDFMLEFGDVLWTWELRELPTSWRRESNKSSEVLPATRLADHRSAYLDYEGPLTGNRGHVARVASGTFTVIANTPEMLIVQLDSEMYCGRIQLTATSQQGLWQMTLFD